MISFSKILAAFALIAALASCDLMDNRDRPIQYTNDIAIVAQIQGAFRADPALASDNIQIQSVDGTVLLRGSVASEDDKNRAINLVSKVNGIRAIDENITVMATVTP
jgi:hyperosmotically inducible protein